MKKQTKVLLATALLTLGASFTAMAATYDWQIVDGEWVCYNEDGDTYDNEWVESAGKDYYVGDDGVMLTSQWVDEYYLDSTGTKTINAWKYLLPEGADDDDDAEEAWYYFGSKGKVTTGKKVIDGKTYYFDAEGVMLTGWVEYADKKANEAAEYNDNVVYVGEDGARVANVWLESVEPGVDEEEVDDPDYFWYYIGSNGAPKTGRQLDINGETYFFNSDAQMLSGWVATTNGNAYFDLADNGMTVAQVKKATDSNVYYCGDSDEGWAKKSTWINEYRSTEFNDADADEDDMYWFWVDSKGKLYAPTSKDVTEMEFVNGAARNVASAADATKGAIKTISSKKYVFNSNGEMLSGLVNYNGDLYYFGGSEDGSMKTGAVVIEDTKEEDAYKFYFAKNDDNGYAGEGIAVTGAAEGSLYADGLIVSDDTAWKTYSVSSTDEDYVEVKIGNLYYVIDEDGDIKTSKKPYKAEDSNGVKYTYIDTTAKTMGTKGAYKGSYTSKATVKH